MKKTNWVSCSHIIICEYKDCKKPREYRNMKDVFSSCKEHKDIFYDKGETMIKKIWNWIKGLLKRFKFDNALFEKGIDVVINALKEQIKGKNLYEAKELIKMALLHEFYDIKPLVKFIDKAVEMVDANFGNIIDRTVGINKKLDKLKEYLVDTYNNHF